MSDKLNNIKPLGFQWETRDPFLFCVHHEDYYPKGNEHCGPQASLEGRNLGQDFTIKDGWRMYHGKTVPGFPGHPHRGFETITVVRKGLVDHSDSLGASGRYGNGDVQWMTAGKGLQHAEMFPLLNKEKDNPLELFQIWLNLPKKSKMVEPFYKMLWSEDIPVLTDSEEKVSVEVIAGELGDVKPQSPPPNSWAFEQSNEVAVWNVKMKGESSWLLPKASQNLNRTLYFYSGQGLMIDGMEIPEYHSVELNSLHDLQIVSKEKDLSFLVLQGKPIEEPVAQYGPFVMNSQAEIEQAYLEYHKTQFGGWPWKTSGPVHGDEIKRFAKYADGRSEEK